VNRAIVQCELGAAYPILNEGAFGFLKAASPTRTTARYGISSWSVKPLTGDYRQPQWARGSRREHVRVSTDRHAHRRMLVRNRHPHAGQCTDTTSDRGKQTDRQTDSLASSRCCYCYTVRVNLIWGVRAQDDVPSTSDQTGRTTYFLRFAVSFLDRNSATYLVHEHVQRLIKVTKICSDLK